ncbi:MAG: nitroreductase family protein [Oligoflexia bacterium]|nr:nitroreductase family protein [Oligoflexia bacterium]
MQEINKLEKIDIKTLIKARRSVRSYLTADTHPVSDYEIEEMIDAARFAPSASNAQPWYFIIIKNQELIKKIAIVCKEKIEKIFSNNNSNNCSNNNTSNKDILNLNLKDYIKNFYFFKDAPYLAIFAEKKGGNAFLKILIRELEQIEHEQVENKQIKNENLLRGLMNSDTISVSMAMQNFCLMAYSQGIGTCIMTGPTLANDEISKLVNLKNDYQILALSPFGKIENFNLNLSSKVSAKRRDINKILQIIK